MENTSAPSSSGRGCLGPLDPELLVDFRPMFVFSLVGLFVLIFGLASQIRRSLGSSFIILTLPKLNSITGVLLSRSLQKDIDR